MAVDRSGKRRRKVSRRVSVKRRRRARFLFGLVLTIVIVAVAISFISMLNYLNKFSIEKICRNVYIGNVDVSRMTPKEAEATLKKSLDKDRAVTVKMVMDDGEATATLEELGVKYKDIEKAVSKAFDYGKQGSIWSRYRQVKKTEKEKVVIDKLHTINTKKTKEIIAERAEEYVKHAVNSTISKTGKDFKITKEKNGKIVDSKKTIQTLTDHLNNQKWNHKNFSIDVVMKVEKPTIKEKDLKTIKDQLSTFSTDAGGGQRWQNLKTGVEKINGNILMPGQEFSVHDITAPYDAEHGYVEAGSYENGQVVDSFGGGICQVSTTLYNTVLYAELEVVERYPHSMLVAYVDPSRDAAIAGDVMDLRFKNNYETPVLITGEIDAANQLVFTIYGKETRPEGRMVEYESETLSTEEYGVKYKEDPEAALGSIEYSGSPHTGKTAQLWKVVTQDGVEQSRDVINHSSYAKSDQIIKIGTKSENAEAAATVRQAIGSQQESTIQNAITKARGLPQ